MAKRQKREVDPVRVKVGYVVNAIFSGDERKLHVVKYVETAELFKIVEGHDAFGYSKNLRRFDWLDKTTPKVWFYSTPVEAWEEAVKSIAASIREAEARVCALRKEHARMNRELLAQLRNGAAE